MNAAPRSGPGERAPRRAQGRVLGRRRRHGEGPTGPLGDLEDDARPVAQGEISSLQSESLSPRSLDPLWKKKDPKPSHASVVPSPAHLPRTVHRSIPIATHGGLPESIRPRHVKSGGVGGWTFSGQASYIPRPPRSGPRGQNPSAFLTGSVTLCKDDKETAAPAGLASCSQTALVLVSSC